MREAAGLDWSEIDPSILGTLFERGLDPDKRSQLGAHYTDRDKIMQIVDPVIVRPWLAEWVACKEELSEKLEQSARGQVNAGRRAVGGSEASSASCGSSWRGWRGSGCWTRPAGRATSFTWRCTR